MSVHLHLYPPLVGFPHPFKGEGQREGKSLDTKLLLR